MADLSTIKTQLLGRRYGADDIPATPDTGVYALYLSDLQRSTASKSIHPGCSTSA